MINSMFKQDNVFSMTANLPDTGPLVNRDIDYYRTFFGHFIFISVAMFVGRREANAEHKGR